MEIFAAVEKNLAVFFLYCTSKDQIPGVFPSPDFRVSCVGSVSDGRICDGRNDYFLVMFIVKPESVVRRNHKLGSFELFVETGVGVIGIDDFIADACINQVQFSVFFNGASGKASV